LAVANNLEFGRRYTGRTNQVQRSFEDAATKEQALELVLAA
jgi:elongation factor P hydroxylase